MLRTCNQLLRHPSKFTEHGIEGVVPMELLPPEVQSKYQSKPADWSKRTKKEETKCSGQPGEDTQIGTPASETEVDGSRNNGEGLTIIASGSDNVSQRETPTPDDEHQKHNSGTDGGLEAGQIDDGADTGMVDGETDADGDLDVVS